MTGLDIRIQQIRDRIDAARHRRAESGFPAPPVTLVAVTKTFPVEVVEAASTQGLVDLGESRPQEFRDKVNRVAGEVRWHFIGRLQRNKVKYVVGRVALVHSVDRWDLAEAISERAVRGDCVQDVLLQVNVSKDPAKAGFLVEDVGEMSVRATDLAGIRIRGLMTIPSQGLGLEATRKAYRGMAELSESLRGAGSLDASASHLSMGMSGDFEVAIEEGATLVRIGTGLFGSRPTGVIQE